MEQTNLDGLHASGAPEGLLAERLAPKVDSSPLERS